MFAAVLDGGFGASGYGAHCCRGSSVRAETYSWMDVDPHEEACTSLYSTATTAFDTECSSVPIGDRSLSPPMVQSGGAVARDASFSPVVRRVGSGTSGGAMMDMDAAATPRRGLRRSLSHSNLNDRSGSIDRPSVMQCIRAIGFIMEHMMREDSYRERCADYDFAGPVAAAGSDCWGEAEDAEGVVADDVASFLHSVYSLCKWTPECNIMALILIVRLFQYNPDMTLHRGNWRPMLLTALMIAQKTWDDRALRNKDFPAIWASVGGGSERLTLQEVNMMEREFLRRLDHQLFIAPSMYASTYFELCSLMPSEEEIKRQLHQLIEIAGENVRVVKSAQVDRDNSFSYNTAEVMCFSDMRA